MNKKAIGITCGALGCLALLAIVVLVAVAILVPGYFLRQAQENQPVVVPEGGPGSALPAAPGAAGEAVPGMNLSGMQTQAIDQIKTTVPMMPFLTAPQKERVTAALGKLRDRAAADQLPMASFQSAIQAWGEMLQDGQVTDAEVANFEQIVTR